jgi:hypothetical protein
VLGLQAANISVNPNVRAVGVHEWGPDVVCLGGKYKAWMQACGMIEFLEKRKPMAGHQQVNEKSKVTLIFDEVYIQ